MRVGLVIPTRATKIFQVQFHAGGACNLRIRLSAIPTFARGQKKNLSSAKADGVQFQPVGFVKPAFFRAQKLMERNSEGGGGCGGCDFHTRPRATNLPSAKADGVQFHAGGVCDFRTRPRATNLLSAKADGVQFHPNRALNNTRVPVFHIFNQVR